MMGALARLDDYATDPMTGLPIGAALAADPPPVPPDLRGFAMGSLAAQGSYQPFKPSIATGTTPWKAMEIQAAQADTPRDPTGGDPATTKQLGQLAANVLIPTEPWEYGLAAMGPAGRVAGKLGKTVAAMGGIYGSGVDDAEAGARDPRLWSRLSSVMMRKPLDEMQHTYANLPSPPVPRILHPEQLLGETGIFTPWDIARTGGEVTHIDGNALARAVALHGGPGFPQANPGMAAASEHAISSRLDNDAAKVLERTGRPPLIIPITGGGSMVDASHHVADPLSQMVQTAPITKKDLKEFNATMRERVTALEAEKKDPSSRKKWMNTDNPAFQDYINNMEGGMKIKSLMAKTMEQKYWQDKGLPNVTAVRHAVSEPGLIDLPTNTVGMAVSRYEPGRGLIDTNHPSYSKGVGGHYMGQLASMAPLDAFAPSMMEGLAAKNAANKAAGKKVAITPAYHLGKPSEGIPTTQYFDEQWLENFLKRTGER